eukprot:4662089-Amphidinium_carterae.1
MLDPRSNRTSRLCQHHAFFELLLVYQQLAIRRDMKPRLQKTSYLLGACRPLVKRSGPDDYDDILDFEECQAAALEVSNRADQNMRMTRHQVCNGTRPNKLRTTPSAEIDRHTAPQNS